MVIIVIDIYYYIFKERGELKKLSMNTAIVSASDISKNFGKYSKIVKEESHILIIKNNKPDTVLIDFEAFNNIMNTLNHLEDQHLLNLIEERKQQVSQKGYTLEDLRNRNRERRTKMSVYE